MAISFAVSRSISTPGNELYRLGTFRARYGFQRATYGGIIRAAIYGRWFIATQLLYIWLAVDVVL